MTSTHDPPPSPSQQLALALVPRAISSVSSAGAPSSTSTQTNTYNPGLNGPSTTVFAYAFVAVALTAVALAGIWRCLVLRRTNEPFFPAVSVFQYDDQWVGLGYAGFAGVRFFHTGGDGDGEGGKGGKGSRVRPKVVEIEVGLPGSKGVEGVEGMLPLNATVPSSRTQDKPALLLTVLILPPSEFPVHPLQRYPDGQVEDEDLPELELGTIMVDVESDGERGDGTEWEEVRRRGRKEEKEWEEMG